MSRGSTADHVQTVSVRGDPEHRITVMEQWNNYCICAVSAEDPMKLT